MKKKLTYAYDFCRNARSLRTRTPTLNDHSRAIKTAIPPNKTWLGSVENTKKEKAMPQQPRATMAGRMRLCGPRTPGERNGRLRGFAPVVAAVGFTLLFREGGALCGLLLASSFLRLRAFGIW